MHPATICVVPFIPFPGLNILVSQSDSSQIAERKSMAKIHLGELRALCSHNNCHDFVFQSPHDDDGKVNLELDFNKRGI